MTDNIPLRDEGVPKKADLVIPIKAGKAYHFAFYTLWVIEVFLLFRLVLKLLAANPENIFAKMVYWFTAIIIIPFDNIFNPVVSTGPEPVKRVFETSTLFGMIVYAILVWSVAKFIIIKESKISKEKKGRF